MSNKKGEFERMALPHMPGLYRLALRLCRNPHDAQDLVQDAMVKAFRFFHRFETGSNERAWLYKLTVNLFYNRYQQQARQRAIAEDASQNDHLDRFVSEASLGATRNTEADLLNRVTVAQLQTAMDALAPEFRAALILCDVLGFSYREIADIADCPVGTVMSRIYRARRQLRSFLETEPQSSEPLCLDEYRRKRGGNV